MQFLAFIEHLMEVWDDFALFSFSKSPEKRLLGSHVASSSRGRDVGIMAR